MCRQYDARAAVSPLPTAERSAHEVRRVRGLLRPCTHKRTCPKARQKRGFKIRRLGLQALLRRCAFYYVDAELRVLLTNLGRRLKLWRIECCLRLLKVLKREQDYALR